MAVKEHSLDISAKLDMQEMKNAVIQAQKEIDNRYDFKGISKEIDLNVGAKTLTLISSSDNKIDAMLDIMISKMNKRDISINSLEELKKEFGDVDIKTEIAKYQTRFNSQISGFIFWAFIVNTLISLLFGGDDDENDDYFVSSVF